MDAIEAINRRQGVLHYQELPVEQDKIETVLKAASAAPSILNLQPWAFVVVTDPGRTRQLARYLVQVQAELIQGSLLRMPQDVGGRMVGQYNHLERVPCFVLLCLQAKADFAAPGDRPILRDWYLLSLGAAMQNLMVAATALGLGTRWFTGFTLDEEGQALKRVFGIPQDVEVVGISSLGYPDEPAKERPEQDLADVAGFRPGDASSLARLFRGKLPLGKVLHDNKW